MKYSHIQLQFSNLQIMRSEPTLFLLRKSLVNEYSKSRRVQILAVKLSTFAGSFNVQPYPRQIFSTKYCARTKRTHLALPDHEVKYHFRASVRNPDFPRARTFSEASRLFYFMNLSSSREGVKAD